MKTTSTELFVIYSHGDAEISDISNYILGEKVFLKSNPEYPMTVYDITNDKIITKLLDVLNREYRMIMPYELTDLPNDPECGDIMPIQDFIDSCNHGCFIDYDGFGHYVLNDKESNIDIYPSDIEHNSIRKEFDKIIWFNR